MSNQMKFKRALFGLKKKSVNEYINSVSKSLEDKLFKKDTEITKLKKEIESLTNIKAGLEKQISDFSEEKSKISEVFMKAEESAEEIINEANMKAEALKRQTELKVRETLENMEKEKEKLNREFEIQINAKKTELSSYKSEINYLREKIRLTLDKFDEILENSIK